MRAGQSVGAWSAVAVAFLVTLLPFGCVNVDRYPPGFMNGYPSGPDSGAVGESLRFAICAADTRDMDVSYLPDWGDASRPAWTAPYQSGLLVSLPHSYADTGTFRVRFKARVLGKYVSQWSDSIVVRIAVQRR
jgi:hypothetical protein